MILSSLPKLNAAITPVPVIPFACMSDFLMTFPLTGSIKSPSSTIKNFHSPEHFLFINIADYSWRS